MFCAPPKYLQDPSSASFPCCRSCLNIWVSPWLITAPKPSSSKNCAIGYLGRDTQNQSTATGWYCTSQWNVCWFIIAINHRYNPHKHEVIGVMFTNWFHYGARPYCLKNDGQPRDIRGTMGYRYCRMGFTESRVPLKIHWLITILLQSFFDVIDGYAIGGYVNMPDFQTHGDIFAQNRCFSLKSWVAACCTMLHVGPNRATET